jgi:hypothetical protein
LLASAPGGSADSPAWSAATISTELTQPAPRPAPADKGCTKMEVSEEALWFAVDEEGNVDYEQAVDGYPSGTLAIAAGFEYNCIPKKIAIVTVFYKGGLDTAPLYTDREQLKATKSDGIHSCAIGLKSGQALPDDSYQVRFFANQQLLTSGEIMLGEGEDTDVARDDEEDQDEDQDIEQDDEEDQSKDQDRQRDKQKERERRSRNKVRIIGTIYDTRTGRPIIHAVFLVLNPGISVAQWVDYNYAPSDILGYAETNRDGEFALAQDLDRNVAYSFVAWALSYQGHSQDGFVVTEDDPDPVELTIELTR